MKKLLFLVVCTLLLLFGVAAPALADAPVYWVSPYGDLIVAYDASALTITPVATIPAGSQVGCGSSWISINRGLAATVPYAFRMRLTVTGPAPAQSVVAQCSESDCQGYWTALYRWNDACSGSPGFLMYPYNPKVSAGVWARDWFVTCGTLDAGTYTVSYNEMLTRTVADPMWNKPGSYPPVYPGHGWADTPLVFTFEVE